MNKETGAPTRTRYGTAHPERVENAIWERAIRENWSGYQLRTFLGIKSSRLGRDFSHSDYREAEPGPSWSWLRYGRTSTPLPDGRVIHIAGEHEDYYDPDFCIYNDVVVEHPDGRRDFFLYSKSVFPPTDFHSATLIDHEIVLIGSLGYRDLRRVGEIQVLKLDTQHLAHRAGRDSGRMSRLDIATPCGAARGRGHCRDRRHRCRRQMTTRRIRASSSSISRP